MRIFLPFPTNFCLTLFFSFCLMGLGFKSKAATCTAQASGNWTVAATWSCGHAPTCNDMIVIPNNYTVTVTSAIDLTGGGCANTKININGVLFFSGNASRLDLVSTATITIASGAAIMTDVLNNSQKITIGSGPSEWNSNLGNLFGPWVITNGVSSSTLPVELIDFSGFSNQDDNITLSWVTASETNNDYFEVQKSYDAVEFQPIGKITSAALNGNSSGKQSYELIDNNVQPGINYYRIKQVDQDNHLTYHKTISVMSSRKNQIVFDIYPNPNNGSFLIDIKGIENNREVEVRFYDKNGKLVYNYFTDVFAIQSKVFNMNIGDEFERGIYVVSFTVEGVNYYSKLVLE